MALFCTRERCQIAQEPRQGAKGQDCTLLETDALKSLLDALLIRRYKIKINKDLSDANTN